MSGGRAITRRDVLKGWLAAGIGASLPTKGGVVGDASAVSGVRGKINPDLAVVMSDLHVGKPWSEQKFRTDRSYDYVNGTVRWLVAEMLSMKTLPSHVFVLGDVSVCFGEERDYEIAEDLLRPLEEAGIKIVLTAGNHDRREPMRRVLGKWLGEPPVAGRFASVTHLPKYDVILLDSLKELDPAAEDNSAGRGGCGLGPEQSNWLAQYLGDSTRPALVCAHHSALTLGIGNLMVKSPVVCGYIHGHNHSWLDNIIYSSYARKTMIRMVGIPSMGMDRDIGFAVVRAFDDRLELAQVERDYYFPVKTPEQERLPLWDRLVKERHGRRLSFPFDKLSRT